MTPRPTTRNYPTLDNSKVHCDAPPFSTRTQAEAAMRVFDQECLPNLRVYGFGSNVLSSTGSHVIQVMHRGLRLGEQQREKVNERVNLYLTYHPTHCVHVDYGINSSP